MMLPRCSGCPCVWVAPLRVSGVMGKSGRPRRSKISRRGPYRFKPVPPIRMLGSSRLSVAVGRGIGPAERIQGDSTQQGVASWAHGTCVRDLVALAPCPSANYLLGFIKNCSR